VKVVVVGAGAIGACVAYRLAREGAEVTLLDGANPAESLSAHSFGWVNAVVDGSAPYYDLTHAGLTAHGRLAGELPGEPWFFRHGNLHWADTDTDGERLLATAEAYRAKGYPVTRPTRAQVLRDLEPELLPERMPAEFVHYPSDAHVDGGRLISALLTACRGLGVRVRLGAEVTGFLGAPPGIRGVVLASGEAHRADAVVCCAGRGTTRLVAEVGSAVPLAEPGDPERATLGLLVRTNPVRARVRGVVHAPRISVRPHSGGRLLLHCHDIDHTLRRDDRPERTNEAAAEVLSRLAEVLPAAGARVESAFVGIRPMPRDGMSVLGWVPGTESLYVVVTHSGVTLAAVLGEIVAREVLGTPDDRASTFRPNRFAPNPLTR